MKKQEDIFKANGDVINNARGDIFNAKGDIFNARGDVFNTDGLPTGQSYMPGDEPDPTSETLTNTSTKKKSFLDWLGQAVDVVDKGVDVVNKYKTGGTVTENGVTYDIAPGSSMPKKDNTIWYVVGGVVLILIIVAVIAKSKK